MRMGTYTLHHVCQKCHPVPSVLFASLWALLPCCCGATGANIWGTGVVGSSVESESQALMPHGEEVSWGKSSDHMGASVMSGIVRLRGFAAAGRGVGRPELWALLWLKGWGPSLAAATAQLPVVTGATGARRMESCPLSPLLLPASLGLWAQAPSPVFPGTRHLCVPDHLPLGVQMCVMIWPPVFVGQRYVLSYGCFTDCRLKGRDQKKLASSQ